VRQEVSSQRRDRTFVRIKRSAVRVAKHMRDGQSISDVTPACKVDSAEKKAVRLLQLDVGVHPPDFDEGATANALFFATPLVR